MNRDPFLRFALIALCIALAVVLWLLFRWVGFAFAALGTVAAILLTIEKDAPPTEQPRVDRLRTDRDGKPMPFDLDRAS